MRAEGDLPALLAAIARTISDSLGYETVVINLYRPAWDDFCVTTVHGDERARTSLLGQVRGHSAWEPLLIDRFCRRGAFVVPTAPTTGAPPARATSPTSSPGVGTGAWHPEDALFLPMRHADGHLLGILSVDEPVSRLRPTDEELDVLVSLADHAALAVQSAQEAADAARHRLALEQLLRVSSRLNDEPAADEILRAVCTGVRDALGFQNVLALLVDPETSRLEPRAAVGWSVDKPQLDNSIFLADVEPLLDPAFELRGCFLLPSDEAERRVPSDKVGYVSQFNGRGPRAWNRHWLLVPLHDSARHGDRDARRRPARGPGAAAVAGEAAGAPHLRGPGGGRDHRLRHRLRSCASSPTTTRSRACSTGARSSTASTAKSARATPLRPHVRARGLRPRRLQAAERPLRPCGRRRGAAAVRPRAPGGAAQGATSPSGSAATSSPCSSRRRRRPTCARSRRRVTERSGRRPARASASPPARRTRRIRIRCSASPTLRSTRRSATAADCSSSPDGPVHRHGEAVLDEVVEQVDGERASSSALRSARARQARRGRRPRIGPRAVERWRRARHRSGRGSRRSRPPPASRTSAARAPTRPPATCAVRSTQARSTSASRRSSSASPGAAARSSCAANSCSRCAGRRRSARPAAARPRAPSCRRRSAGAGRSRAVGDRLDAEPREVLEPASRRGA